jgi:hypothetical protein
MLEEVVVPIRHSPFFVGPAVLEANGIGSEDHKTLLGQCRPKSLKRVSRQADYFAFAQMPLAIVLVMDENPREWPPARRQKKVGGDVITFTARIGDQEPRITSADLFLNYPVLWGRPRWV